MARTTNRSESAVFPAQRPRLRWTEPERSAWPAANSQGQTHSYKASYDPGSGKIEIWRDGVYVGSWTDPSPLQSGSYLSLRTNATDASFDNLAVEQETKYYYAAGERVGLRVGNSAVQWLIGDQLGSTSVTADAAGNRQGELWYKPYGASRSGWGTTPTQRRFTGQTLDDVGGGLYYYGARYYDPYLNRFISPDTIVPEPGNPQALNRYSYSYNNPLRWIDPSGHRPECGAAVGACGNPRYDIFTRPDVEPPTDPVEDVLLERAWRESRVTQAEMKAAVGSAAKEQLRQQVEKSLPPIGAASVGACGSFGVGGYGTACVVGWAADSNGNVQFLGGSIGGGGTTGLNLGLTGNLTWLPNATDVGQLAGPMVNAGISAGVGPVVGLDWVGSRTASEQPLHGFAVSLGVGAQDTNIVLPGEFHGGGTTTGFTPWRFNVWDVFKALTRGW